MRLRHWYVVAALALAAAACGPGAGGPNVQHPHGEGQTQAFREVTDDAFAGAVHDLLLADPRSAERDARLAGVEARVMTRADGLFRRRATDRGVALLTGGLYLVRNGELKKDTFGISGKDAVAAAVKELAGRGDEGRSRALYEILARIAPPAEQPDVKLHLDALAAWQKDTLGKDASVAAAGDRQEHAMTRRLLEPSQEASDDAAAAVIEWVERARDRATSRNRGMFSQYERAEAVRAIQSGGSTLVALYLRDADAAGAIAAVDKAQLRPIVPAALYAAVAAAADKPTADHWIDVLRALFPSQAQDNDEDDPVIDRELLRAAAFSVAAEAYRIDPTRLEAAATVAEGLQIFGMGEASPSVLADACRAHPDAQTLSFALQTTTRAIDGAEQDDDLEAARRTYKAAAPILELAAKSKDPVKPTVAKVKAAMGEIELRDGRPDAARALLKDAMAVEPAARSLISLARIELHDGDAAGAAAHLKAALATPEGTRDAALRGELLLNLADADGAGARGYLEDALRSLLAARVATEPLQRARIERTLARVLDRFGQSAAAVRAVRRALDATPRDKSQMAASVATWVGGALLRGDLASAREGLGRGVAADLDDEDIVYYALWVRALERQANAKSDGVAERTFERIENNGSWASKLAAFGLGRLKADDLMAAASSPAKRAEATFYVALDRRAAGDKAGAEELLKAVAAGPGIDLLETEYARTLLRPNAVPVPVPAGVTIP
jgi:hypothetical protein